MLWVIAAVLCTATALAGAEIVWLFIAAGLFGAVYYGGGLPRLGRGAGSLFPLSLLGTVNGFAWTGAGASPGTMPGSSSRPARSLSDPASPSSPSCRRAWSPSTAG
jgi:hypothetical protein